MLPHSAPLRAERGPIPTQAGIGLRFQHHQAVVETRPDVPWFEVHTENYMGGGTPLRYLEAIRRDYPLSCHGVGLSLGSAEGLDPAYLERLRGVVDRIEPALVSEHLSWSAVGGRYLADLLPLPMTEETLDLVCRHVDQVQTSLGRRILIENPSSYLRFRHSTIPEWEFLAALASRSGCGLLCDVNNIYVSACNHGWNPSTYLSGLDPASIGEIHLAGHSIRQIEPGVTLRIDNHGSRVCAEVWRLYAEALARFGPVPTLIEWDNNVPPLATLLDEAAQAAAILARSPMVPPVPPLLELQQAMYRSLVEHDDGPVATLIIADGLPPESRLGVYRNTFFGSLTTALRLSYPAVHLLVGGEFFEGAAALFIAAQPPESAYLDEYGGAFPEFLASFPPAASLAYLPGVARLEWAINRALHAPDLDGVAVSRLAFIDPAAHDRICFTPHPAVGLVHDDAPIDLIWRAVLDQVDKAMAAIDLQVGPVWLLIERSPVDIEVSRIDALVWRLADELFAGHPIEAAIAAIRVADAPRLIAEHLAAGRFVDFALPKPQPLTESAESYP